ncbi:MAG: Rieske (2Fe-2S) protein [Desulfofustis sp.]|jgi:cytochrome b6-f complex iron-sulfur subunit
MTRDTTPEQRRSDLPENPRRRTLLNRFWALLGLLACIELGWLTTSILKSRRIRNRRTKTSRFIDGGLMGALDPGEVKAVPEGMFFISRLDNDRFIALSRTCTHLGCAVSWDEREQKFICPCHGSSFDRTGVVLTPPAVRPLDFFATRIEDGRILVDVSQPNRRENFDQSQTTAA